ncbi:hypothetical protein EUBHAL_00086 [Anaerobutyricum hallii DSM 3353]|uniref:Uncharacterized protein n=1 Tax=Anaerobutyricum hallii DSM 3353 TaxID=411469 RepID=C0ERS6_9FIRM|nr:hypothetical protein EUBHAL_00086 [Anaerobutyricum hallii DSM 3353]
MLCKLYKCKKYPIDNCHILTRILLIVAYFFLYNARQMKAQ